MKNSTKQNVQRVGAGLALLVAAHARVVLAEDFKNPIGETDLYDFLLNILNAVIYILFPVIVLMIVFTGFLFVAAQGNVTKLQTARRALVWTVVGALIVLGSKALALAIEATVRNIQV